MKIGKKIYRENGQALVEYIILLVLIMSVLLLALNLTGLSIKDLYCRTATQLGMQGVCDTAYCLDNFDNINNWSLRGNSGWEVVDGRLCNTSSGEQQIFNLCSQKDIPDHYRIRLDNVVLDQGNGYGIFYNMQTTDPAAGYAFQYDPGYGSGAFVVRKWVNGSEVNPPIMRKDVDMDWHDDEHDLTLEVNGSQIRAYLDGELITEFEDETYTGGSSGIRTWDSTRVCLDSFTIDPLY